MCEKEMADAYITDMVADVTECREDYSGRGKIFIWHCLLASFQQVYSVCAYVLIVILHTRSYVYTHILVFVYS